MHVQPVRSLNLSHTGTAAVFSLYAGLATGLAFFLSLSLSTNPSLVSYSGYVIIVSCAAIGWYRPFAAVLSAYMLLAINPGYAIPHTFTSAPSDYLIGAATISILIRSRFDITAYWLPVLSASLLAVAAGIAFIAGALGMYQTPIDKFFIADCLGLVNMSCYILAPVMALRSAGDVDALTKAAVVSGLVLLATGLIGGVDTLACTTSGVNGMYTTAGFRDKGLLGDPNIFGIYIASLMPILVWQARRWGTSWAVVLALTGAALIVVSGSRTGLISGGIAVVPFLLIANRNRLWVIPVYGSALILLALAPTVAWPRLPCPFGGSSERVLFNERNAGEIYFARQAVQDSGVEQLMSDYPIVKQTCAAADGASGPSGATAEAARIRECAKPLLEVILKRSELPNTGYKQLPAVTSALKMLPLDEHRRLLWGHAISIGLENPAFGIGFSNLTRVTPNNWRSHNTPLTTFAEQGFTGIALLMAAIAIGFFTCARSLRVMDRDMRATFLTVIAGATVCMIGTLSQDMLRQPICWSLVGLVTAGSYFGKRSQLAEASIARSDFDSANAIPAATQTAG